MKPNRYLVLVLAVCTFLAAGASARAALRQSADTLFQQGNALYEQGHYPEALQLYNQIIREDGFSGPLFYNLANCYAQMGQTGPAILNYERALRLSPGDAESKGNLELLRKNQHLEEELPLAQRAASLLDLDQWTWLAGLFLVLFTLVTLAGIRLSAGKQVQRWIGGLCFLFMVMASGGAFFQFRQQDAAVVVSSDARLLLSPFPSASSLGALQEGRIVHPLAQHGRYSLVEDRSGRRGWVQDDALAAIMAGAPRPWKGLD